jgi:hypothetical protein
VLSSGIVAREKKPRQRQISLCVAGGPNGTDRKKKPATSLGGCDFFHLFLAASSGASNCDSRIGAVGRRDVWDWIGSLKGELFSTEKPRALMI